MGLVETRMLSRATNGFAHCRYLSSADRSDKVLKVAWDLPLSGTVVAMKLGGAKAWATSDAAEGPEPLMQRPTRSTPYRAGSQNGTQHALGLPPHPAEGPRGEMIAFLHRTRNFRGRWIRAASACALVAFKTTLAGNGVFP